MIKLQTKTLDYKTVQANKKDTKLNVQLAIYSQATDKFLGLEKTSLPVNYPEFMVTLMQKYNTMISVHVNYVENYSVLAFNSFQELNDLAYAIEHLALKYRLSEAGFEKLLEVRYELDKLNNNGVIDTIKLINATNYPIVRGNYVFLGFRIAKNKAIGANLCLEHNRLVLDE